MSASRGRVRPCSALSPPRSVGLVTTISLSVFSICIREGTVWLSSPSGPDTCTRPGDSATLTPAGNSIGRLPILLISVSREAFAPANASPDEGDHLAADAAPGGLAVGDHPGWGGHDSGGGA